MSKPFCSTGEPWDNEADLENSKQVWEVFRDKENGDVILWLYGKDGDTAELRMSRVATMTLAATLAEGACNNKLATRAIKKTSIVLVKGIKSGAF